MILHICISEKFMPPFIEFVETHFDPAEHLYAFITSEKYQYGLRKRQNQLFLHTERDFITLQQLMEDADKIILHGLWRRKVNALLIANSAFLAKSYWVMWGGDFYFPELHDAQQHQVIEKVGHLVTGTIEEVDKVREWYGAGGKHIESYVYTSNIAVQRKSPLAQHTRLNVLLGNNAAPSNKHIPLLARLERHKDSIEKIILPLSYAEPGGSEYRNEVINFAKDRFGEKCWPLTEYMPLENYIDLLETIDIAMFEHNRQQGMGNIINLLGMGITVWMDNNVTTWQLFQRKNIQLGDIKQFEWGTFPLSVRKSNMQLIQQHFSEQTLKLQLQVLFNNTSD